MSPHTPARINPDTRPALIAATAATVALAAASFVLSFEGLSALAPWAAVPAGLAWLIPSFIDGAIGVYTWAAFAARARGESTRRPWAYVAGWTTVSSAANAAHAWAGGPMGWHGAVGAGLAALFPVGSLLAVHELAHRAIARPAKDTRTDARTPDTLSARPHLTVTHPDVPLARIHPARVSALAEHRRTAVTVRPVPGHPGTPSVPRRTSGRAAEHRDTIVQLHTDGQSVRAIAAQVGLGRTAVHDIIRTLKAQEAHA